jgi:hypothetical protein
MPLSGDIGVKLDHKVAFSSLTGAPSLSIPCVIGIVIEEDGETLMDGISDQVTDEIKEKNKSVSSNRNRKDRQ